MNSGPNEQGPGLFPLEAAITERGDIETPERAQLMIDALTSFDEIAEIETLLAKFRQPKWLKEQESNLGKNIVYKWRRQQIEKHQLVLDTAKEYFLQAYNSDDLANEGIDVAQIDAEQDRRFTIFETAYRGTSQGRFKKREQAKLEYQNYIDNKISTSPETQSVEKQCEIHQVLGAEAMRTIVLEPELAETKDKLIGLRDDSRAGFIPTTHREKSQAFELLDYLDPVKYPTGVNQRLDEIARHQQKVAQHPDYGHNLRGKAVYEFSQDAVRSVIHEWGDHLQSAIVSHGKLQVLKEFLDSGINPRISVGEAATTDYDEQFEYTELVRFINLKSLRDGKAIAFDPLRTKEDRTIMHPHKNKIIEDVHTAKGSSEEIKVYIDEVAHELSVKDGRHLLDEALNDQANRRIFWYRILKGVNEEGFQDKAEDALKSAGVPTAA